MLFLESLISSLAGYRACLLNFEAESAVPNFIFWSFVLGFYRSALQEDYQ
jgi:hypothetical protein